MSYGTFIGQLKKGIEGEVTAYDCKPQHGGCFIYLKKSGERILVESAMVDSRREEALELLRAKILQGLGSTPRLVLGLRGGEPAFWEEASSTEAQVQGKPSTAAAVFGAA